MKIASPNEILTAPQGESVKSLLRLVPNGLGSGGKGGVRGAAVKTIQVVKNYSCCI